VGYVPIAIGKPRLKAQPLLPFLILHLLDSEPDNGYGLMRRIDELTLGRVAVNPNMIYPLLNRLDEQHLIAGEWVRPTPQRRSHAYRITAAGKAQLDEMRPKALQELRALLKAVERLYTECHDGSGDGVERHLVLLEDRRRKYFRDRDVAPQEQLRG